MRYALAGVDPFKYRSSILQSAQAKGDMAANKVTSRGNKLSAHPGKLRGWTEGVDFTGVRIAGL